jgi:hypothetical protein
VEIARDIERLETPQRLRAAQVAFRTELHSVLAESWIMHRSITSRGYPATTSCSTPSPPDLRRDGGPPAGRSRPRVRSRAPWSIASAASRGGRERLARRPAAVVADIACGPCRLGRTCSTPAWARARASSRWTGTIRLSPARQVLGEASPVELWHENAIRIARSRAQRAARRRGPGRVLGLFDYLPIGSPRAAAGARVRDARRRRSARRQLRRDNPSRVFMEWSATGRSSTAEREFWRLFEQAASGRRTCAWARAPGAASCSSPRGSRRAARGQGSPRAAAAA